MGKVIEVKINRFDGGLSDDVRQPSSNKCAMVKHFDIFSNPYKLTPFRATEADVAIGTATTALTNYNARDFQFGTNGKLYAIGVNGTGSSVPIICYKSTATTGVWISSSTASSTSILFRGSFNEWQDEFYFIVKE